MKNSVLIFLGAMLLLIPAEIIAQNSSRLIRQAARELNRFNLDPMNNQENLAEAQKLISEALETEEGQNEFQAWQTRGEIYNASLTYQMTLIGLEQKSDFSNPNDALMAFESFKKALKFAEKNFEKRDALDGLTETAGHLGTIGNIRIGNSRYDEAFVPLNATYEINQILVENDRDPIFEGEEELNNHLYVLGITGLQAGERDLAEGYLTELYEKRYDEPRVYTTLFELYLNEDEDKAIQFLEAGKEVDPENIDLLYAEINYYITKNDIEQLQQKLRLAIEKDPENYTLYNVLGNVFMNLMTEAMEEEGEEEMAEEHFEAALGYLKQAIELEPTFFEPYYTIGSMYFNKAAVITQRMNELGLSKDEQKLYNEYNEEATKLFDKALPYFQKAESLEANDATTLLALREVYARKQNFEMVQEFNDRLETIEAGSEIESSYFSESDVQLEDLD